MKTYFFVCYLLLISLLVSCNDKINNPTVQQVSNIYSIVPDSGRAYAPFVITCKNLFYKTSFPRIYFGPPKNGIEFEIYSHKINFSNDTIWFGCIIPINANGKAKIYIVEDSTILISDTEFKIIPPIVNKKFEFTSFFPPSLCSSEYFYLIGKNFLGHNIKVTFDNYPLKIHSISDTLIKCSIPPNIPFNDYELTLYADTNTYHNGYIYQTKKIIYGKPKINSVVPAANAVGGSVTIYADNLGSTVPRVFFGNSEAKVTSYSLANYGYNYHPNDPRGYIERLEGYIKCIVPPDASTPIYIRGNCGDIVLTSKFTFIPFTVKSVLLELRNINWKYSFQSEYSRSYDSTGTFTYFVNPCSNITGYNNDTKLMELYASGSYLTTDNGTVEIKQSYAFKNDDISFGNFSDYYSSASKPGHTMNSNYRKFSCHLARIDKSYENDSVIVYTMNRNEIDQYLSDLKYEYGEAHGAINVTVRSKYIITQQLPASDSSKIILTIFKK